MEDQSMEDNKLVIDDQPKPQKRFSLWSEVLVEQEQSNSSKKLTSIDLTKLSKSVKKKIDRSRDVEGYEFWKKTNTRDKFVKPGSKKSTKKLQKSKQLKKLMDSLKGFVDNLEKNDNPTPSNQNESSKPTQTAPKDGEWKVKLTKSQKKRFKKLANKNKTATEIATKLREPRMDLIQKCIKVIGEDFAMKIFGQVLGIESSGGLMTSNGSRRRSAGGVFFHLVKMDTLITKEQKDQIFGVEAQLAAERRKVTKKQKKRLDNLSDALEGFGMDMSENKRELEKSETETSCAS